MRFDVLSKSISTLKHAVLEASAGTGKTFSIQHLALRLLLEKRLKIQNILIVTFTKASTRELVSRVRNHFEETLLSLKKGQIPYPYLELLPKKEIIQILEEALISFHEASIYTIHGFCHEVLQNHAFLSRFPLELSFQEEAVFQEKKEEFLKHQLFTFSEEKYHFIELGWLMKDPDLKSLSSLLLKKEGLLKEPIRLKNLFQKLLEKKSEILPFFAPYLEDLEKVVEEDFPNYKKSYGSIPDILEEVVFLKAFFEDELSLDLFASWVDKGFSLCPHFSEKNRKKTKKAEISVLQKGADFFCKSLGEIFSQAKDRNRIIENVSIDLKAPYEKFLKSLQIFSPDDLLYMTQKATENPLFCEALRLAYRAVIIDESQDTDPVQWSVFEKVFVGHVDAFFLVGDPKQSIYGFRSADIYTYLKAAESMQEHFYLDTNYRSEQALLSLINRLFSYRKNWLYLPKKKDFLPYLPVEAGLKEPSGKGSLLVFFAKSSRGRWPSKEIEETAFLPYIAKQVAKKAPFEKESVAILVSDRYQGARVESYLREKNLPVSFSSAQKLTDMKLYVPFRFLFEALFLPDAKEAVQKCLLGPFWNYSSEDLIHFSEDSWKAFHRLFADWKSLLVEKGLPKFFFEFFQGDSGGKSFEERLVENGLFQEARNLLEHMMEVSQSCLFSLDNLADFFQEMEKLPLKPLVSDKKSIQIITIHSSKGLEFDVVIPLGLIVRTQKSAKNPQEADAEKFRQLYVALTRAKKEMYIPFLVDLANKELEPSTASSSELFLSHLLGFDDWYEGLKKLQKEDVLVLLDKLAVSYTVLGKEEFAKASRKENASSISFEAEPVFSERASFIQSFSSLKKPSEIPASSIPKKEGFYGTEIGIFIHKVIEKALGAQRRPYQEIIKEEIPESMELFENEALSLVKKALHTPLFSGGPSPLEIPWEKSAVESEFLYEEKGELYKGYFDFLFELDGLFYIIDWKTNYLGEEKGAYGQQNLMTYAKKMGYHIQGEMYQKALKKFLKNYNMEEKVGGAFFVFLRGEPGVLFQKGKEFLSEIGI